MSGADCYALRCALLHEGSDSILRQYAREALERFAFVAPSPGREIHCNQLGTALQLQVDIFCEDVCKGVDRWEAEVVPTSADVQARLGELVSIRSLDHGFTL